MHVATLSTRKELHFEDEGITLDVTGRAPWNIDFVFIEKLESGNYGIAWLVLDESPRDYEWYDGASLTEFRTEWERDEYADAMRAEVGADRVFIVEKVEHGHVRYSVYTGTPSDPWDSKPSGVLVVDPEALNPETAANDLLDEYTRWANGEVYVLVGREVTPSGTVLFEDETWGFIGTEYAVEAAKQAAANGGVY